MFRVLISVREKSFGCLLSLSSEGEHFFRGQRHAMRGIRRWPLVLYKIIINFLCSSEIILPNTLKWALGSPWLLNIAVSDAHNPSSELCAFTSCSFSSDITFSKFTIAGISFWISANSMLCNTRVAVLWCPPQMAVSQKGLTSAWSSWSFITLPLKSMWAGSGHTPGKALCSHPEKIHRDSHLWEWEVPFVLFLLFSSFL